MLLHEKMRLQRKINKLTLKQLHMGNVQERMQRKIDKREKYYSKLEKQIERQASSYINMANNSIFNTGAGCFNPNSIFAGSAGGIGYSMSQQQAIQAAAQEAGVDAKYIAMYMQNSMAFKGVDATKGSDGNYTEYSATGLSGNIPAADMEKIIQASQMARYMESSNAQYMQAAKNQYNEQVEAWKQAQLDMLDMQKEWEMDMLEEEQADMEADKTSVEAQLELAKQRKEAIEQELGNSIKDAAPKFGLS